MNIDKLVTLKELSEIYPKNFPKFRVKYLCAHRKKNGFDTCLRFIGCKLYVNLDDLEKWVESRRFLTMKDIKKIQNCS
ncbi:hypothetical protein UFOVP1361_31 [uncultured Caudovirales phage]|uniref:Uncharacterized protein n=1 Tax=uncultured Caudovirales phage TaxID=2100421 RepID=A0A6J5S1C0_9CAUD|nr:hypothetical protein UFOVP1361_31 [uncultured Caudovirales phage]